MLLAPFNFLGRHGPVLMASGLLVGLALPGLAALLRPVLPVFIFLITGATMLRVEWPALAVHVRRPLRLAAMIAWLLGASPLVAVAAVRLLPLPPGLAQAVVLWAASPPLSATPAFALLMGLDGAQALLVLVSSTFLMPLTVPPLALGLTGLDLGIGILPLMERLVLFIGGAALGAEILRRLAGAALLRRHAVAVNGFNVLLMALFAIAVMDGVRQKIAEEPATVALFIATALAASIAFQALTFLVFARWGRAPGLTIGLISGYRNLALTLANLGSAATPEIALFFIAIQIPIYLLPATLGPAYRRLRRAPPRDGTAPAQ